MRLRSLHPAFGVEVLGLDVTKAVSSSDIDELRAHFDDRQMLLLRGQGRISAERHVEVMSWFGEPACEREDGALWTVLSNEDAAGAARLQFHSDLTYCDHPVHAIGLHALELPDGPTTTAYVSGQAAWDRLPAHMQETLAGLTLRHRLAVKDFGDWPEFVADHPLRFPHPRTGRPILLATEYHAHRVLELGREASDRLIGELFAYLYDDAYVYEHQWALHDLLIWDNLAIQHARPEEAVISRGRRTLQRVALSDVSLEYVMTRAREREVEGLAPVEGRR
jgi:taurine dioxygenase